MIQFDKLSFKRERELMTKIAFGFIGKWYSWGGNDPSGFDCSGFACELLKSLGFMVKGNDKSASDIYSYFHSKKCDVEEPYEGCFVFWFGTTKTKFGYYPIVHVEYCINEKYSIGASGGTSKTITKENAIRDNAFIKVRPIKRDRKIAGYIDPFKLWEEK